MDARISTRSSLVLNFLVTAGAVIVVLVGYEIYQRHARRKYVDAANVTRAFVVVGSVKPQVSTYFADHGKWPSSNVEAGLPESSAFADQSLSGLEISDGGVITLTFKEAFGQKNGVVRFTPSEGPTGLTDWKCTTPSFSDIEQWVPQCSYVAGAESR